jgi:sRNA-binding regulator protein Hfq
MRTPSSLPSQRATESRLANGTPALEPRVPLAVPVPVPPPSPGPRRLVRPTLPERAATARKFVPREASPMLTHQMAIEASSAWHDTSHAEGFYFQKQMQSQTPMVFVLEDGERVEGYIEWYDKNSIKVRSSVRTLIYKSSIKYLYKASEVQP